MFLYISSGLIIRCFVDLEMSLAGVATALEVSAPGQLRDDQMGVYRELELEVGVARGLANKLRARHLEAYHLQGGPVVFTDSSGIGKRLRTVRMRLDEKLAVSLRADHCERTSRMLLQRLNQRTQRGPVPHRRPRRSRVIRRTRGRGLGSQVAWKISRGSGRHGKRMLNASIMALHPMCW